MGGRVHRGVRKFTAAALVVLCTFRPPVPLPEHILGESARPRADVGKVEHFVGGIFPLGGTAIPLCGTSKHAQYSDEQHSDWETRASVLLISSASRETQAQPATMGQGAGR